MVSSTAFTTVLTFILSMFVTSSHAVGTTLPHGKRGLARIMPGAEQIVNSSILNKRSDEVTWYSGSDLDNAACFGRDGLANWNAKSSDMIGAMAMHNFDKCFKCMQITNNRDKSKKIIVEIVDICAGCKYNTHIDLTPGAFEKLAAKGQDLNTGVLSISYKPVKCPSHGLPTNLPKKD